MASSNSQGPSSLSIQDDKELQTDDNLTIFTAKDPVDAATIKKYVIKHWEKISVALDNSIVLFIGGIHGDEHGGLGKVEENWKKTLKGQVSFHG